ncbi:AlpA family transcriptional regulator [Dechloromonas sp.]|uniref:helix-turn-helix transcriptional regulator n=1 Tax=Dechloromonas sp. TaxID=1917218 RepID=UPI00121214BF|nr:AlpA family phage regulatory protein [Dechloromonas sp.]MBU3696927.1 AlpA family phage regulatory protein [Dechloromonas sp.]TEX49308.1 MAG: transcriptional regulator [Rhodocyclaceae bacterium]
MERQQGNTQSTGHQSRGDNLPDALKGFDSLPDSANVRLPVVRALLGCSSVTVWRMVKRGTLPAPRKLTERVTIWNVGELRKVLGVADSVPFSGCGQLAVSAP